MKTVVPANPIKIYQRLGDIGDCEYTASNIAFILVDNKAGFYDYYFVTISGTSIPARDVAFARVLIDGQWVSHD